MSYIHLTEDERYHIDELQRKSFSQSEISKKLGRSRSTLLRELRRNKGECCWRPRQAQMKASARLIERGSRNVRRADDKAWIYAKIHLEEDQWSPEQISGRIVLD